MRVLPPQLTLERSAQLLAVTQGATGPDRNLDFLVFVSTAPDGEPSHWSPSEGNMFSASTDEVFRLFDTYLPGWEPGIGSRAGRPRAYATQPSPFRPFPVISKGRPTRPLALLEAFLLATRGVLEARAEAARVAADVAEASSALRETRLPLAELIRGLRTERGWTQEELGRKSGTSQAYVSGLETGASGRGSDPVLRALDLDPSEYLPPTELGQPLRRASSRDTRKPRRG